jgi:ribosomal-protein-alanine N-acetyltransferase
MTTMAIERISLADTDDLDAVVDIEQASYTNPWTREMFRWELENWAVSYLYVARTDQHRVAAYCACWLVFDELHINNLAVRPDCRRHGIGTQLLQQLIHEGRRLGARRATLEVRRSNEVARRLYEQLGFRIAGERPRYYSSPVEDALILWREGLDEGVTRS